VSQRTPATITVFVPVVSKASVSMGRTIEKFDVQFNPKEYSIQKSASWEVKPSPAADQTSVPEFKGANSSELTIELFLDATTVTKPAMKPAETVQLLFRCCTPEPKTKQQKKPSPPFVFLKWGKMSFYGLVKQVSAKYTLFSTEGEPLRAICTMTLQEVPTKQAKQNPTSGALEPTIAHRVVAGDSLASIAWDEYQDPAMWRQLAVTNGIDDPLRLREGAMVLVPSPDAHVTERVGVRR